ncbi:hypothetical protein GIB67_021540, partial [Kingdonia uniflora]
MSDVVGINEAISPGSGIVVKILCTGEIVYVCDDAILYKMWHCSDVDNVVMIKDDEGPPIWPTSQVEVETQFDPLQHESTQFDPLQYKTVARGRQKKITYKKLNVSTEPPLRLPQNYEPCNFRRLTQSDESGHLSTSVGTISARVGFKCRSVLVNLREMYLILIEVPHLKHKLKATNLMSLFDCKIGNSDNQVIVPTVERWWATTHIFYLPYGELGITPRDFMVHTRIGIGTGEPMVLDESYMEYGNTLKFIPDMESKDNEKGCISFAHLRTYLDHTRVNIKDLANTNTIFRAFMLLYFGGVLFGNSKSWARLELLGPISILDKKRPTINFGSAILGHLYYCLDQASKQEVKYIGGLFQLIEISHHILIDNRLDDYLPRMSAWHIKRQKLTGNKEKYHLSLMRQQLDLRIINNIQWDPFRNMKDALKREEIIAGNISRKGVLLQSPFGRYEWYLGDLCLAQLEHRAVLYDPPEKLHCFSSPDVDTQIPPPQLGDYPGWIMEFGSPHGTTWHTIPSISTTYTIDVPTRYDFFSMTEGMRKLTLDRTSNLEARHLHGESRITHLTADLRRAEGHLSQLNDYLDGEGTVVDWEDNEGEAGTSQVGTSRGKSSRGRTSEEGEEEEDIDESSTDYSDDDVIDMITMEILCNQAEIDELQEAESSGSHV